MSLGFGRYDIVFMPIEKEGNLFLIELKKVKDEDYEKTIEIAKKQIEDKKYETDFLSKGYTNIHKIVIVFKGKDVVVREG